MDYISYSNSLYENVWEQVSRPISGFAPILPNTSYVILAMSGIYFLTTISSFPNREVGQIIHVFLEKPHWADEGRRAEMVAFPSLPWGSVARTGPIIEVLKIR